MRYLVFSIIFLFLGSPIWGQRWECPDSSEMIRRNDNSGHRMRTQVGQRKGQDDVNLTFLNWPGLPDSTIFNIQIDISPNLIEFIGDTTLIGNDAFEGRVYFKGGNELEWDVTFHSRPNKNSWSFPLIHQGLEFLYQPELTQKEIDHGAFRPDSVIGSYAVYHASKSWNEYKTGKAFHIYRPKAWDAFGDTVWCDLEIDDQNNEMRLTLDRAWLRNATYPVTVDPTFGYTTAGGSEVGVNNTWSYGVRYPPDVYKGATGGELVKTLLWYGQTPTAGDSSVMAIYDWSIADSCLDSRLALTGRNKPGPDIYAWWEHSLEYELSANDSISIAVGDFESGTFYLKFDTQTHAGDEIVGDLPATWGSCGTDNWRFSIYGVYNAEGPYHPDSTSGGTNWTTPDSIRWEDNYCAEYDNTGQDILAIHGFGVDHAGFDIPADATIDGIEITMIDEGQQSLSAKREIDIGITRVASSQTLWGSWKTAQDPGYILGSCSAAQSTTYGGSSDKWGIGTVTVSDVNDSQFGFIIRDSDKKADGLYFDSAVMTIYFTPAGEVAEAYEGQAIIIGGQ